MKNKLLFFLGLFIPALFVYKAVLLSGPLAFGDAPYFYKETMDMFLSKPLAWWGMEGGLGGVSRFIWIAPLMYVYSFFGSVLGLGHNIAVRLVFYFPAIILSFVTPIYFTKYLKLSKLTQFFSSLIYGLNTYFILLIDGGQVGVALAYGLFPLCLVTLKKLTEKINKPIFFKSLFALIVLTLVDPRISLICFLTIILWQFRKSAYVFLVGLLLIPLNMFWILPLIKNGGGNLSVEVTSLNLISLLNSLTLYQPHWPNNIYGAISYPPFYFVLVPVFIFGGLFFKKTKNKLLIKQLSILFLVFVFLSKGQTPPLGQFYQFIVERIPFGSILRDSSKFFVPLMLFGGILIGNTVDRFKNKNFKILSYLFLLVLITPALFGKLNFVLSGKVQSDDYNKIYKQIQNNPGEYKTLWFPEKPTLGFASSKNPAISAKSLTNLHPLASINGGSSDRFNFFNQPVSSEWMKLLGVRYMFFPGETRKLELSDDEKINWGSLLKNISKNPNFKKLDWGTDMDVYEAVDYKSTRFEVTNMVAMVGADNMEPEKATIFIEDVKTDTYKLLEMPEGSFGLSFNEKDETDLKLSFIRNLFLNQSDISKNDWATYGTDQYLLWKYQLLIRGIQTSEFDYGKGILFSTQKNESVEYKTKVKSAGKYVVAVRGMGYQDNELLISVNGIQKEIVQKEGGFGWQYVEVEIEAGKVYVNLTNKSGMQVVNTIAVIPLQEWVEAEKNTEEFVNKFSKESDKILKWIIYSQNYHPQWKLDCGNKQVSSTPIYSMINGFLIDDCENMGEIYFDGQKNVDLGIKISLVSLVLLVMLYVVKRRLK